MITNRVTYSSYKIAAAGCWLEEIPEHWDLRRLRTVTHLRVSNVDKHVTKGETAVRLCNYVDVYKNDQIDNSLDFMHATATGEEVERFRLEKGDVLITKDSEAWDDIGVPALVTEPASDVISGYHLALLRPRSDALLGAYLFRALQSNALKHQFHVEAKGVTRYGLSHAGIKSVRLPLPPLSEQTAIARFLDRADERIQRYTCAKQKQIALLREQKQAVIHQAVTGQIDVRTGEPYASYKTSGVDWLRNIPVHWEMVRNGRLFVQRNEIGFPGLPILEVSLKTGVRVRDFENSDRKQAMSDPSNYKRAIKEDIAYNMMRMWQGAVGVTPVDGLVSPAYVVATALPGNDPRYFGFLFRTSAYMVEVDKYSRGIVRDRNRLYWEDFKQIPSPCPPLDEQVLVADAITHNAMVIGEGIQQAERQIDLVREYRARLIADVVTGKLDVRSAVPELPGEDIPGSAGESTGESTIKNELTQLGLAHLSSKRVTSVTE